MLYDFKALAVKAIMNRHIDNDGHKVDWTKIHAFEYLKSEPRRIYFKYDLDDKFSYMTVRKSVRRASKTNVDISEFKLETLYDAPIPISEAKYKDLVKLCDKGLIPEKFHNFYKNLSHSGQTMNNLPEPDEDETESEDEA